MDNAPCTGVLSCNEESDNTATVVGISLNGVFGLVFIHLTGLYNTIVGGSILNCLNSK